MDDLLELFCLKFELFNHGNDFKVSEISNLTGS